MKKSARGTLPARRGYRSESRVLLLGEVLFQGGKGREERRVADEKKRKPDTNW